ncbi:MAG: bifunctional methylenetetrahydrofolate dehydrogenase/methenyltetrahydrofolate cyclohydrolase FolD [Gammaproteobacteria bacterium]|nr:bifunctional methylenetetrahydrofolate dehydrogenase/methenyltetrahydrofolate cyclohydrolase FolD [Gammaproteobacteria bacterium]
MSARILDGKEVAAAVREEVAAMVAAIPKEVGLATVLVGDDPASHVYVRSKRRTAGKVGITSIHNEVPADVTQEDLEALVLRLNADPAVDGIIVQLPLPDHLDEQRITSLIDPGKDVDGLHPYNLGLLALERPKLVPCTPQGVMRILDYYGIETSGARAVIVGRSFLVGRPLGLLLGLKGTDATVTMAHSRTRDLSAVTREADILVAAVGRAKMIGAGDVKPGATVIDVGINRTEEGLVGDVDFDAVVEVAGSITPVPGGVGPMTVAMLMRNTAIAARSHVG